MTIRIYRRLIITIKRSTIMIAVGILNSNLIGMYVYATIAIISIPVIFGIVYAWALR
jgi:hypothetical protein